MPFRPPSPALLIAFYVIAAAGLPGCSEGGRRGQRGPSRARAAKNGDPMGRAPHRSQGVLPSTRISSFLGPQPSPLLPTRGGFAALVLPVPPKGTLGCSAPRCGCLGRAWCHALPPVVSTASWREVTARNCLGIQGVTALNGDERGGDFLENKIRYWTISSIMELPKVPTGSPLPRVPLCMPKECPKLHRRLLPRAGTCRAPEALALCFGMLLALPRPDLCHPSTGGLSDSAWLRSLPPEEEEEKKEEEGGRGQLAISNGKAGGTPDVPSPCPLAWPSLGCKKKELVPRITCLAFLRCLRGNFA